MTVYEIGILTHYYCRVVDHADLERQPPIWPSTVERLVKHNMIEVGKYSDRVYSLTERGRAYVLALMRVPMPEPKWVIEWPIVESLE